MFKEKTACIGGEYSNTYIQNLERKLKNDETLSLPDVVSLLIL